MRVYIHALRQSLVTLALLGASGVQADVRMQSVSPEETERSVKDLRRQLDRAERELAAHEAAVERAEGDVERRRKQLERQR